MTEPAKLADVIPIRASQKSYDQDDYLTSPFSDPEKLRLYEILDPIGEYDPGVGSFLIQRAENLRTGECTFPEVLADMELCVLALQEHVRSA